MNFEKASKDAGINLIVSSEYVVTPQDILTAGYHFLSAGPVTLYEPRNAGWL
jgi:hypothetical protein